MGEGYRKRVEAAKGNAMSCNQEEEMTDNRPQDLEWERFHDKYNEKRQSAIEAASGLFNIPDGFSSGLVERMVDDIIGAAVLEMKRYELKDQCGP